MWGAENYSAQVRDIKIYLIVDQILGSMAPSFYYFGKIFLSKWCTYIVIIMSGTRLGGSPRIETIQLQCLCVLDPNILYIRKVVWEK